MNDPPDGLRPDDSTDSGSDPKSDPTYLRTYERTKKKLTSVSESQVSGGAEGSEDGLISIADVIEFGFLPNAERFPLVRTGEREPIPWHVRAAVYYRDRGRCQFCKTDRPKPWHLDHIIPWSTGGPDNTENLRLLCEPCNMRRSNFNDLNTHAKMPCTWWCHRCYMP